jgi:predicted nucleotidyltransferase
MIRGSDVDLLIDLGDMKSGLVFVELKRKLERKLGRKVDLVSYGSLNYSRNRASILSQAKVIYER